CASMVLARGRKFSALPRTEPQNPAGRRSPRRGFALAVLPFDRSIALSLKCCPTAQIRQGMDRDKRPDPPHGSDGPGLVIAPRAPEGSPGPLHQRRGLLPVRCLPIHRETKP